MATIINTPGNAPEDSSVGVIIGVLVVLVLIVLFFVFAYPNIRGNNASPANNSGTPGASTDINVTVPSGSTGGSNSGSGGSAY